MPLRWHVNLPGPVAYSRPMRKRRRKHGALTSVLTWFIVKPLELMIRGLVKLFAVRSRSNTEQAVPAYMPPGWYNTAQGPLYFNGRVWVRPDGRPF